MKDQNNLDVFLKLKDQLLNIDPVAFCEKYLTLDGKPFRLSGNGYKPLAEIYRYVGIKALEDNAKPIIIVKGRQVGATTMASALEMYFMGSGLFGNGIRPAIRVMHTFPLLEHAASYSKTKLQDMINSSVPSPNIDVNSKKNNSQLSYMQALLDKSTPTNNSLHFKQFVGGNHLWIESTGIDADRLMGRTSDVMLIDECFPYKQKIATEIGKINIGKIYEMFKDGKKLPLIYSFNEKTNKFELKEILHAWNKGKKNLIKLFFNKRKIECTENHEFLTEFGWKQAKDIKPGTLIKSYIDCTKVINALNEDQLQIVLGSFLGDGHLDNQGISRYRLICNHGIKQKEYCEWKASMFNTKTEYIEKNGYSQTECIRFNTKLFGINETFPKIKTHCPQWVLDKIDARGIAIWFMDDAHTHHFSKKNSNITLSTCSFDEDSQKRIVKKLQSFGIDCYYKSYFSKNKNKSYFYIKINKLGAKALFKLISPYIHNNISCKIKEISSNKYIWDNKFKDYCWDVFVKSEPIEGKKIVFDIEVKDNHNFVLAPNGKDNNHGGPIVHNCQKTPGLAIGNALKILTTAKYGKKSKGVQVFFGTPRKKGSDFHRMWQSSSQQYYYLGCQNCQKHFPLYTPESDSWKEVWIHTMTVKCTHCGFEQNKLEATERGKWIGTKDLNDPDCAMIGFHLNQLYMPMFTREDIDKEAPGKHPVNTEKTYQNEVMGEFYQGDSSPITHEEIQQYCADYTRKFSSKLSPSNDEIVVMGIDYGARSDIEQMADSDKVKRQGQSFSTAVILQSKGPGLLSIEYAVKFKRNDIESKKGLIDQMYRQYGVNLMVGDIGFSQDFSELMHTSYGDKYLVSRALGKVNNNIKYKADSFPKEIDFARSFYIGELFEQMKKGMIRFPYGDFEKIGWLVDHCASMEIKPILSKTGDPTINYVKGGSPNDGFMALLNAYIAYKFLITNGFQDHNPYLQNSARAKPVVLGAFLPDLKKIKQ